MYIFMVQTFGKVSVIIVCQMLNNIDFFVNRLLAMR